MKKYFKPSVFFLSLFPFFIIVYKIYFNQLGPEPVKEITHHTGEWSLIFICLTLLMSPLKSLTNLTIWIKLRRMLGLFVFFYATIHLITYVVIDYRLDWQQIFGLLDLQMKYLKLYFDLLKFVEFLALLPEYF